MFCNSNNDDGVGWWVDTLEGVGRDKPVRWQAKHEFNIMGLDQKSTFNLDKDIGYILRHESF